MKDIDLQMTTAIIDVINNHENIKNLIIYGGNREFQLQIPANAVKMKKTIFQLFKK